MGITCQILLFVLALVFTWIITDVVSYGSGFNDGYNEAISRLDDESVWEDAYVSNDL